MDGTRNRINICAFSNLTEDDSKCFGRNNLVKYFEELGRHDLKNEMIPVEDEVFHDLEFLYALTQVLLEPSIYAVLANVIIT